MFAVCADELTEQGKCLNLSYIQLKMLVLKHFSTQFGDVWVLLHFR